MKKTILNSSLLILGLGLSSFSFAEKMDIAKPDMDGDQSSSFSERKEGVWLDDSPMNSQLLADELEIGQGFIDPELLAELDLEDLETFDNPLDEPLMTDR